MRIATHAQACPVCGTDLAITAVPGQLIVHELLCCGFFVEPLPHHKPAEERGLI